MALDCIVASLCPCRTMGLSCNKGAKPAAHSLRVFLDLTALLMEKGFYRFSAKKGVHLYTSVTPLQRDSSSGAVL